MKVRGDLPTFPGGVVAVSGREREASWTRCLGEVPRLLERVRIEVHTPQRGSNPVDPVAVLAERGFVDPLRDVHADHSSIVCSSGDASPVPPGLRPQEPRCVVVMSTRFDLFEVEVTDR